MSFFRTDRWTRLFVAGAMVAGALAAAPLVRGRAQETPPPAPQTPDVVLAMLDERVNRLEQIVAQQQAELDQLHKIAQALYDGANRLALAADVARELGFEFAGANPAARTELLGGMWAFQDSLVRALPPPPPAPDEDANSK